MDFSSASIQSLAQLTGSRYFVIDYEMITQEFQWPVENEAGRWESVDPWPRPLAGVRIDGEHVCFRYRKPYVEGRDPLELAAADFKMLADFADLSSGDSVADGRLFRFVSRYGALGLCKKHGWPFAHQKPNCPSNSKQVEDGSEYEERIADWLKFSRLARAILRLQVQPRGPERDADLAILKSYGDADPYRAILHWQAGGELKLWFRNRPPRLTLYGVPPLWTAIGLELATVAVGAKGIVLCSACGRLDSAKRPRTNQNRRSYCAKCRDKGRKRQGVADYRDRVRRTRGLRGEGKSVTEIAELLGIGQKQVKRYLAKGA